MHLYLWLSLHSLQSCRSRRRRVSDYPETAPCLRSYAGMFED